MVRRPLTIGRILCPTDFSEFSRQALAHAARLARWFEARLTVLHVASPPLWALPQGAAAPYVVMPMDVRRLPREEEVRELHGFVEPIRGEGVALETRLADGNPALEIQAAAEAMSADLIVMGTHGRSGFERLVLGSITENVVRRASCPVLTVGNVPPLPNAVPPFRRILCAADLTDASDRTLEMALSFAEASLARLTLLHVVENLPEDCDSPYYAVIPEIGHLRRQFVGEARERLERAASAASHVLEVDERVETGAAWRQILRVAQETHADLIVVGAHTRGALGRMFFGSTASHVMRQSSCPVLVMRETAHRAKHDKAGVERATVGTRGIP